MIQLYIGNKNYSSWSMRPWVLLRQAGIDFEEVMLRFDSFEGGSTFKAGLKDITPVGKVPVLQDGALSVVYSEAHDALIERHKEASREAFRSCFGFYPPA